MAKGYWPENLARKRWKPVASACARHRRTRSRGPVLMAGGRRPQLHAAHITCATVKRKQIVSLKLYNARIYYQLFTFFIKNFHESQTHLIKLQVNVLPFYTSNILNSLFGGKWNKIGLIFRWYQFMAATRVIQKKVTLHS